jgi:acylphosphatase
MVKKCIKAWVGGRVQGVWFRGATHEQANRLGIAGYAKNLADGRVEVLACGDEADLDILIEWLKQGPEYAHVTDLQIETVVVQLPDSFRVD